MMATSGQPNVSATASPTDTRTIVLSSHIDAATIRLVSAAPCVWRRWSGRLRPRKALRPRSHSRVWWSLDAMPHILRINAAMPLSRRESHRRSTHGWRRSVPTPRTGLPPLRTQRARLHPGVRRATGGRGSARQRGGAGAVRSADGPWIEMRQRLASGRACAHASPEHTLPQARLGSMLRRAHRELKRSASGAGSSGSPRRRATAKYGWTEAAVSRTSRLTGSRRSCEIS